ncbi:DUF3299 domain-containing protein [Poseidonocella sedimentorum]|uniref:Lipoprotein n=1 Tax=Poseidonocella sedimentorum TaxID=871652 RepID=A0A1I6ERC3_9RHOB|nr:DUF3299 domain-containing protein [Poseidonocella sedimentorum]SFR20127.1 hypothetical protein SAMN04515673_1198 [Poseidonocella sedimentorum]
MVKRLIKRRSVLAGLAATGIAARGWAGEEVIELGWADLLPDGATALPPQLQGVVPHESSDLAAAQPVSNGVRTEWNGRIVSLPGFIVPLDYEGTALSAFILVPFVGACVHVPPPPANQLVLVTTPKPYESSGTFEPVRVTGMFGTAASSTQLAEIGYALSADRIEPYRR